MKKLFIPIILLSLFVPFMASAQFTENKVPINQVFHVSHTQTLDYTTPGSTYNPNSRVRTLIIPFSELGVSSNYDLDECTAQITNWTGGTPDPWGFTSWIGARLDYPGGPTAVVHVYKNAGGTQQLYDAQTDIEDGEGQVVIQIRYGVGGYGFGSVTVQFDFEWTKNGDIAND